MSRRLRPRVRADPGANSPLSEEGELAPGCKLPNQHLPSRILPFLPTVPPQNAETYFAITLFEPPAQ